MYGIRRNADLMKRITLTESFPANIAGQLQRGDIDAGLVPVAIIPTLAESHIISDYCIGATGPVASVGLFSDTPLSAIRQVYLDYQSRTSVALAKILFEKFWKMKPVYLAADENYIQEISGHTAGIVIGDRALALRPEKKYSFDLAEAWIEMTGLPFVFAAWVANKRLPEDFIQSFNAANKAGIENMEAVVSENAFASYDLKTYYTENISYILDEEKKKGLALFLKLLKEKIPA